MQHKNAIHISFKHNVNSFGISYEIAEPIMITLVHIVSVNLHKDLLKPKRTKNTIINQ